MPVLPRRTEGTAPGLGGGLMSAEPWSARSTRRGPPQDQSWDGLSRVKTLPGANQDGSGEAATSSGCAGLREKHSRPPAGQGCPGTAGTIVVAGPRPCLGPGFPRSVLPARMGNRVKEHQETLQESRVLEEARRSLLGANSAQPRPRGQGRPLRFLSHQLRQV